jgi:hypothetical protein
MIRGAENVIITICTLIQNVAFLLVLIKMILVVIVIVENLQILNVLRKKRLATVIANKNYVKKILFPRSASVILAKMSYAKRQYVRSVQKMKFAREKYRKKKLVLKQSARRIGLILFVVVILLKIKIVMLKSAKDVVKIRYANVHRLINVVCVNKTQSYCFVEEYLKILAAFLT